jgi:hypothetical protein
MVWTFTRITDLYNPYQANAFITQALIFPERLHNKCVLCLILMPLKKMMNKLVPASEND